MSMSSPGANASKYALGISNTQASGWGGALAMWMGCVDASAYQGISFWVQGTRLPERRHSPSPPKTPAPLIPQAMVGNLYLGNLRSALY